jgi:hypothetical protein
MLMTDSSVVFLLGFGIQLLFLTNLGISVTSCMSDSSVDRSSLVSVVVDKTTYIHEAERQLSDCRFYEKLDSDPTLDFTQKNMRALEAMHARGHLDNKTMEYLTPEDPKPGRFYLLPKIHRENNSGRPIVSVNGPPTEKEVA